MKTLIIDNYDSFTINLYQRVAQINGEEPLVVHNDKVSWETLKKRDFDNIIISPGPGRPSNERDFGICSQAVREANVPLLGVCLGHQGIGYWYGGKIQGAPEVMHGRLSPIYHDASALFQDIPSPFSVVRYHSLILDENLLSTPLKKTAWTAEGLIMGLQHQDKPIWGVQFHPESICTDYGMQLLANFRDLTHQFWKDKTKPPVLVGELPKTLSVVPSGRLTPSESIYEVHSRKLDFFREAEDVFMGFYATSKVAFWLDSSFVEPGLSRFSFMGDANGPHSFLVNYSVKSGEVTLSQKGTTTSRNSNIFDFLGDELDNCHFTDDDLPFDFNCGFVGYFGYELKADCEGEQAHTSPLPDANFLFADRIIAFDHQEKTLYLVCLTEKGNATDSVTWFNQVEEKLQGLSKPPEIVPDTLNPIHFELSRPKKRYLSDIECCFDEINRGESYEICLTNHLRSQEQPDPLTFYRLLRQHNPAPYAAFLRFNETSVVCSSPERFLNISKDRWVESKPIKGTCKRGKTPEEDQLLKENLRGHEKDRSENLMIVDLLRNDLGLACEVGTVTVPKLMNIETYATVHQMVSTVRGHLRSDVRPVDCVHLAFPGGSMTGAPKKRTMEIIDRLETEARGIYSGSIGFLALNGAVDLNIVIRTAVMSPSEMTIGVGGAIVALSDPEAEFEETMLKAQALVETVGRMTANHDRPTQVLFD